VLGRFGWHAHNANADGRNAADGAGPMGGEQGVNGHFRHPRGGFDEQLGFAGLNGPRFGRVDREQGG
jgi:hypothetical protein